MYMLYFIKLIGAYHILAARPTLYRLVTNLAAPKTDAPMHTAIPIPAQTCGEMSISTLHDMGNKRLCDLSYEMIAFV